MKSIITLLITLISCNYLTAQDTGIKFENGNWEQILTKAKAENKIIFLDAYAEWCGPCKWMAKNTFTDAEVAKFYNTQFVNAKIDMEKGEGIELAQKYNVRAYPSLLYISPDGSIAHRTCGAADPVTFVSMGKDALNTETNISSYIKRYESGERDPAFVYSYARALQQACLPPDNVAIDYLSEQPEEQLKSEENWKIMKDFVKDYESAPFQYLMKNKDEFAKVHSTKEVEDKIFAVYQAGLFAFEARNDRKGLEELKTKIRESGNPDAEKIILNSELSSLERKKQWTDYAKIAEQYAEKYGWNDPNLLNNIAWKFYENVDDKESLTKALKWVERSIELEEGYYNNDTYAALQYKLGNKKKAHEAAQRAIALARENGEDPKETLNLLEKINDLK